MLRKSFAYQSSSLPRPTVLAFRATAWLLIAAVWLITVQSVPARVQADGELGNDVKGAMAPRLENDLDVQGELNCLARNIYFEARNEPDLGKFAVANVVMNRVNDYRYPETVCKVVQQGGMERLHRCQFSWYCDGLSNEPRRGRAWREASAMAFLVYFGFVKDQTAGALWYHADYVSPKWRTAFVQGPKYGLHIFYSSKESQTAPSLGRAVSVAYRF